MRKLDRAVVVDGRPIRVLHVARSDSDGGAARAAYRLHNALLGVGADSRMLVQTRGMNDPRVREVMSGRLRVSHRIAMALDQGIGSLSVEKSGMGSRSSGLIGCTSARTVDSQNVDVVNVHWINLGFMSIRQVGRIKSPIVWTLHDMWPLTGSAHYEEPGPQRNTAMSGGIDALIRTLKRRAWQQRITWIAPSAWIADVARSSLVAEHDDVRVIPNPLDVDTFCPVDRLAARQRFGIESMDEKVVLFASWGDGPDDRKGSAFLPAVLERLRATLGELTLLIVGSDVRVDRSAIAGHRLVVTGHLSLDEDLASAYSAADVAVVPSRLDNLPQTAVEAQSCGTPVVAFDVGGLRDIVANGVSGALVQPFDVDAMAHRISEILALDGAHNAFRVESRARAVARWHPRVVSQSYVNAYDEILSTN